MKIDGTDITMTRGDTGTMRVTCFKSGVALPFEEGDTVYFTVKTSPSVEQKLIQKVIRDFVDGSAYIHILPEDTKELRFRRVHAYDIQLTLADGSVHTIVGPSKFIVTEEVTYE